MWGHPHVRCTHVVLRLLSWGHDGVKISAPEINVNVNGYVACDDPDVIEVNGPRRYQRQPCQRPKGQRQPDHPSKSTRSAAAMPTTNFDDVNVNVNGYVACDNPDVIEVNGPRRYTLTSTMSTATGPATTRPTVEVNAVSGSNANDKLRRRQRQRQRLRGLRQPGRYRGQRTSTLYVNVNHVNGHGASDNQTHRRSQRGQRQQCQRQTSTASTSTSTATWPATTRTL